MRKDAGVLEYDRERDRWCWRRSGNVYEVRCGEVIRLLLEERWIQCRIELDAEGWYMTIGETSFLLRIRSVYWACFD